jgi:hypothetical protein
MERGCPRRKNDDAVHLIHRSGSFAGKPGSNGDLALAGIAFPHVNREFHRHLGCRMLQIMSWKLFHTMREK